jgi:N-methylhydantoinase B
LNPDGNAKELGSKDVVALEAGDVVSFQLAGAGGYGDPKDRAPHQIAADIADGYVTAAGAKRDYGYGE